MNCNRYAIIFIVLVMSRTLFAGVLPDSVAQKPKTVVLFPIDAGDVSKFHFKEITNALDEKILSANAKTAIAEILDAKIIQAKKELDNERQKMFLEIEKKIKEGNRLYYDESNFKSAHDIFSQVAGFLKEHLYDDVADLLVNAEVMDILSLISMGKTKDAETEYVAFRKLFPERKIDSITVSPKFKELEKRKPTSLARDFEFKITTSMDYVKLIINGTYVGMVKSELPCVVQYSYGETIHVRAYREDYLDETYDVELKEGNQALSVNLAKPFVNVVLNVYEEQKQFERYQALIEKMLISMISPNQIVDEIILFKVVYQGDIYYLLIQELPLKNNSLSYQKPIKLKLGSNLQDIKTPLKALQLAVLDK